MAVFSEDANSLDFERDGIELVARALSDKEFDLLGSLSRHYTNGGPGCRIFKDEDLSKILSRTGTMSRLARAKIGDRARPVRAVLFDKNIDSNWSLGWHQDRTICVKRRIDREGFGPWSSKRGVVHVEPPIEYIADMVTVRAHLDPCDNENGPLMIVRGSHKMGRVPADNAERLARTRSIFVCSAAAGDIWIVASSILHASCVAANPRRRRVLHVDFSDKPLPQGLEWIGIGEEA